MININAIIETIIALIAALATGFIIPWIKSKLTEDQKEILAYWVSVAVSAAEQRYSNGSKKKAYVISFLESKGYTVNKDNIYDEIDALIESSVYALNSTGFVADTSADDTAGAGAIS